MNSTQHFHYIIQGFSRNVTFFFIAEWNMIVNNIYI
jgi:hypothetical protein